MYHTVEFRLPCVTDMEISRKQPLERVLIREGARYRVQLKPYVTETARGPVEVADLFFEEGPTARAIPFACFCLLDGEPPVPGM